MTLEATPRSSPWVGGVDLAGSPRRTTGVCRLRSDGYAETETLHLNDELWAWVDATRPRELLVDAPLSLPRGRKTLEQREAIHFRACDRELRRLGIPFFPLTLGPMRMLTARGITVREQLEARGVQVREGYPGGAQDLWGLPRKQRGVDKLRTALRATGCWGSVDERTITHDELDAVTLALVARAHFRARTVTIGDPGEGTIVLPKPGSRPSRRTFGWTRRRPFPERTALVPLRNSMR